MDPWEVHKAQIFVSYASQDRPLVENFLHHLRDPSIEASAHVWYDLQLRPADDWHTEIEFRLRSADIVLLMLSPAFLSSSYCMAVELEKIRARLAGSLSAEPRVSHLCAPPRLEVRALRLSACTLPVGPFADIAVWPPAGTVQQLDPRGGDLRDFRSWLKVRICEALVARHRNRYDGLTREDELRRRETDPDAWMRSSTVDDLELLHGRLGVDHVSRRRRVTTTLTGALVGAVAGAVIQHLLLPLTAAAPVNVPLLAAGLGFVAGITKPGFHFAEKAFRRVRAKARAEPMDELDLSGAAGLVLIAGLHAMASLGLMLGLPLAAVLWALDSTPGITLGVVIGALFCGMAGFQSGQLPPRKRLQVFSDVRGLYRAPEAPPRLPALSFPRPEIETVLAQFARREDAYGEDEGEAEEAEDDAADSDEATVTAGGADAGDSASSKVQREAAAPPRYCNPYPGARSIEQVRRPLVVVAAAMCSAATASLRAALGADGVDDIFDIEVIDDSDPRAADPDHWRRAAVEGGVWIVLMTHALAGGAVPGAMAAGLAASDERYLHHVYPVLVERGLAPGIPLMERQGLPSGKLAVQDWPIRENAWRNVVCTILAAHRNDFLFRLDGFHEHLRIEREAPRFARLPAEQGSYAWLTFLGTLETHRAMQFDPQDDFRVYPFRHKAWFGRLRSGAAWLLAGAAAGVFADMLVDSIAAAAPVLAALSQQLVPAAVLIPLAAVLSFLQLWRYARQRRRIDSAIDDERNRILRRALWRRCGRSLAVPALMIAAAALIGFSTDRRVLGPAGAALVMLACFFVSRRRVPALLLPRGIPTPHSHRFTRRGLEWIVQVSHPDHSQLQRGRMGGIDSPQPRLISGYSLDGRISAGTVLRAATSSVAIGLFGGLMLIGLSFLVATVSGPAALEPAVIPLLLGALLPICIATRWPRRPRGALLRLAGQRQAWRHWIRWTVWQVAGLLMRMLATMLIGMAVVKPAMPAAAGAVFVLSIAANLFPTRLQARGPVRGTYADGGD